MLKTILSKARRFSLGLTLATTALVAAPLLPQAHGAQTVRFTTDDHGDMVLFGNTLGHDCGPGIPAPLVGTVGACGANFGDSSIDVFWRSDSPMVGGAEASTAITPTMARSQAVFQLPVGATVLYARLYWQGQRVAGSDQVQFERPNVFSRTLARDTVRGTQTALNDTGRTMFSSTADVTALLQQYGPGAYRVGVLQQESIQDINDEVTIANWYVVVFYRLNSLPTKNLTLFDGFDAVSNGNPQSVTLSGFLVPSAGFNAKLGVVAHEGDNAVSGDQMLFNGIAQFDAQSPVNNFFNATRSSVGNPVTVAGDLPQYSGVAGSLNGFDMDVIDVTAQLKAGDTTATITASSTGDFYFLNGFATSISTLKPVFSDTNKTWINLTRNDGSVRPGDVLEYTIVTSNSGTDTGINVTVRDPLPAQLTYVPGSMSIDGAGKTDAAGDDQAELTTSGMVQTLVARIGAGANATQGGQVRVGDQPISIRFRATVNAGVMGLVRNQALVLAAGQVATTQGLTTAASWNSGDGKNPNAPTDLVVGIPTDLQVTIRDNLNGGLPVPGTPIVYTVDIKNLGPLDVTNASVTALLPQLPPGAMITWTCSSMGGGACPAASGSGPIDTSMLNLPNQANITYTITVPNPVGSPLVNPVVTVMVQPPANIPDVKQANNAASTGVSDLGIRITDNLNGMAIQPNMPSVYTVTVDNKGPSAAQNIALSNTLPPGVNPALVTWTCMAMGGAVCPATMGMGGLPANGGAVPKDGSLIYTLNVPGQLAPMPGTFIYQAAVAAPSPLSDPMLSNNSATSGKADLAVAVRDNLAGMAPQPNMPISYTLDVSNAGPNHASGALLATALPTGLLNPTWTCTASGGAVCPAASGTGAPPSTVDVPAGGRLSFAVNGTAPASPMLPWSFSSTITPPSSVSDPNNQNNTASSVITGQQNADLSIQITKSPDAAQPGQPTTYTALVNNAGPDVVTNPTVVLNLPPGAVVLMEPAGMGWTCTRQASSYTCTQPSAPVGMLPPLVAQIVTPVPTSQGGPGGTVLGLVGAPRVLDANPANNIALVDAAGSAVTNADLALKISKNPSPSVLGQETTYTLQLDNLGPDTAQSPSVSFSLPPGSIVTAFMPGPGWSCVQNGLSFSCLRAELAAGSAPPILIKAITPPPGDGSQNAGAVAGQASAVQLRDPNLLNNSASVPAGNPTPTATDLGVRLTRDPDLASPGDTVTYTLQATNKGNADANNVVVTLSVPPGAEILQTAVGEGWTCTQNLNTFVCSRPSIAPGDAPPILVKVRLPELSGDAVMPGVGGATATIDAGDNADPMTDDNTFILDGIRYKLEGGGFGCTAAGTGLPASAPAWSLGLLLALLARSIRRRGVRLN